MKVFTKKNVCVFMSSPHKTMLLNICDELLMGVVHIRIKNLTCG